MPAVSRADLEAFGLGLLTHKGVPEQTARYIARTAVDAEAMGLHTHGVASFVFLGKQLGQAIDPKAEPLVVKDKGATALIDGNGAPGQLAMQKACGIAREKAREFGIAMVGVRRSFWLGALGVYLVPLAQEGFLAQMWAQASTCKDCAPVGGIDARFSTNPVAMAFPTDGDPAVADFSTASVSMGAAGRLIREGRRPGAPIFMDKDGNCTDDPTVMKDNGTILFTGGVTQGHKGYALSLWCEALTAVAGGDCNNPEADNRQSFNLTVIDPEAFAGAEAYQKEMRRFIAHVKSSRLRPGFDEIRLPGERALRAMREAEESGVWVEDGMLEKLNGLAEANGIPGVLTSAASG